MSPFSPLFFYCHHADWGYNNAKSDGDCLASRATNNNLNFLFNPKDKVTFFSGRSRTAINPGLALRRKMMLTTNYKIDMCLRSLTGSNIDPC